MENQQYNVNITRILTMPIIIYVQEAFSLHAWCSKDTSELAKAGMDVTLIDKLYKHAAMLQKAEIRWQEIKNTKKKISKDIKEMVKELYERQALFLHYFRFAFKNNPRSMIMINKETGKTAYPAVIQRIFNLIELGKKHPKKLEAIGFDMKKIKETEDFLTNFRTFYAKKNDNEETNMYKEIKFERDHAAFQLKDIVEIIRNYGQFVFWRNPERKQGYTSDNIHKKNKLQYKAKKAKTALKTPVKNNT